MIRTVIGERSFGLASPPELNFGAIRINQAQNILIAAYDLAFSRISPERILFGTDMPIFFWHGRRTWTEKEYRNFCREKFSWNRRHEPAEVEAEYTFFLYEQMRAILDGMDRHHYDDEQRTAVFWGNAECILLT